ncbi:unnamed protein product [Camellia sinensis]
MYTPTWAVATVCFVLISSSLLIEYALFLLSKYFNKKRRKSLFQALDKIKLELMMLGFISLLLTISERQITKICIPKSVGETFLPCRSITNGGGPEPMDICTSSTSLPSEVPSCVVTILEGHTSEVFACAWSPAGSLLTSGVLGILVLSGVVLLRVLLPVSATDNSVKTNDTISKGAFNDLDKLAMGHIIAGSSRFWAFLLATYWVSFVAYYLLWKAYNHGSDLRAAALISPEVRAENFAILVRDIPPPPEGQTRKEQVDSYFRTIYPDTFYRWMVVTDNKEVLGILVLSGVVLLRVLLPVSATDNSVKTNDTISKGAFNDLDKLAMGHIIAGSSRFWAFLLATYWVSFVAYYLLWKAYNHGSDLRAAALISPEVRAENFAILVRDIPPPPEGQTRKEQVDSYFRTIYPDTFYRWMVVTDNKE